MKIKTELEFISFSDGICDIYSEDDDGNKSYKHSNLGLSRKILGYKRVYAAKAAQVEISNVIKIPNVSGISIHDTIEIKGYGKLDILLIQDLADTNPPSLELTLRIIELSEVI